MRAARSPRLASNGVAEAGRDGAVPGMGVIGAIRVMASENASGYAAENGDAADSTRGEPAKGFPASGPG